MKLFYVFLFVVFMGSSSYALPPDRDDSRESSETLINPLYKSWGYSYMTSQQINALLHLQETFFSIIIDLSFPFGIPLPSHAHTFIRNYFKFFLDESSDYGPDRFNRRWLEFMDNIETSLKITLTEAHRNTLRMAIVPFAFPKNIYGDIQCVLYLSE